MGIFRLIQKLSPANRKKHDKKLFYEKARRFFDDGLMYEIYVSDTLCICNVANQCYAVFPYRGNGLGADGMFIGPAMIPKIIEDEGYLAARVAEDRNLWTSLSILLDDTRYGNFRKFKKRNDITGPTSDIDLDMEERTKKLSNLT